MLLLGIACGVALTTAVFLPWYWCLHREHELLCRRYRDTLDRALALFADDLLPQEEPGSATPG